MESDTCVWSRAGRNQIRRNQIWPYSPLILLAFLSCITFQPLRLAPMLHNYVTIPNQTKKVNHRSQCCSPHVQLPMPYVISKPNTVLVYLYAT